MDLSPQDHDEEASVDSILASLLAVLVLINVGVAFWLPDVLGYPAGGALLLTALPAFGLGATVLALAVAGFAVIRRRRIWAPVLVSLSLLALAAGNAWLWVLCVSSV